MAAVADSPVYIADEPKRWTEPWDEVMQYTTILLPVVALLSWGVWVVFAKLAGESLTGEAIVVITYFVAGAIGLGYVLHRGVSKPSSASVAYAVLGGVFLGVGALAYYRALRQGSTAATTTISALYFVVASVLSVLILGEPLGIKEIIGIGLAVGAVVILTV